MSELTVEQIPAALVACSPELRAKIEEAKRKRAEHGYTPIEHRPIRAPEGIPLHVDPAIPAETLRTALAAAGLRVFTNGGRYVVRQG